MLLRRKKYVHLLDVEFTGYHAFVHPLVAGVEAARVATHGHQAGLLLSLQHGFTVP
jgi:hypothetical protein